METIDDSYVCFDKGELLSFMMNVFECLDIELGESKISFLKIIISTTILEYMVEFADRQCEEENNTIGIDCKVASASAVNSMNQEKITRHNLIASLPVAFTPKRQRMLEASGFVCSVYSVNLKKYLTYVKEIGAWWYFKDEDGVESKFYKKEIRANKTIELDII